jgi:hypothetical protein
MYFTYYWLSLLISLPREPTQIDHHTALTTISKANLRKSNVIDITPNTTAMNQHID